VSDEYGYPLYQPSKLDEPQILQGAYDEATQRIRVEATASISDIAFNVDKDSGNPLKVNADGSINVVSGENIGTFKPTIQNLMLPLANTEYAIQFAVGTKKLNIKIRDYAAPMQLSWNLGESNTNYLSVSRGNSYYEEGLSLTTQYRTVYVRTNKADMIIECISWE
jgi:hypothetical protein